MNAIHRLIAAASLALAMVVSLPGAQTSPDGPASCKVRPCGPQICMDVGTCPSPKPPTV